MAKDYIKFRLSWFEGIEALSTMEKGRLLEALCDYIANREAATLPGSEKLIFNIISKELDRDEARYQKRSQTNRENANKRWDMQIDAKNANCINRINSHTTACARDDDDHHHHSSLSDKYISENEKNEENEGWYSFVKDYEQNIGLMPSSQYALEEIQGYYEILGAEVMREAVKAVALAYPEKAETYFTKVCRNWIKEGVKTKEDAEAQIDRWRRKNKRGKEVKEIDGSQHTGLATLL